MSEEYQFEKTKSFIHRQIDQNKPIEELINLLECIIELLNYPDNDFVWSRWDNAESATGYFQEKVDQLKNGVIPDVSDLECMFLPTSSLDEVSISSGWADILGIIIDRFSVIRRHIWK